MGWILDQSQTGLGLLQVWQPDLSDSPSPGKPGNGLATFEEIKHTESHPVSELNSSPFTFYNLFVLKPLYYNMDWSVVEMAFQKVKSVQAKMLQVTWQFFQHWFNTVRSRMREIWMESSSIQACAIHYFININRLLFVNKHIYSGLQKFVLYL